MRIKYRFKTIMEERSLLIKASIGKMRDVSRIDKKLGSTSIGVIYEEISLIESMDDDKM